MPFFFEGIYASGGHKTFAFIMSMTQIFATSSNFVVWLRHQFISTWRVQFPLPFGNVQPTPLKTYWLPTAAGIKFVPFNSTIGTQRLTIFPWTAYFPVHYSNNWIDILSLIIQAYINCLCMRNSMSFWAPVIPAMFPNFNSRIYAGVNTSQNLYFPVTRLNSIFGYSHLKIAVLKEDRGNPSCWFSNLYKVTFDNENRDRL